MSYRNQYSLSNSWQQDGTSFGVGGYNQNYGGYNDQHVASHQIMHSGYSRNQGSYGGGGGGGGMYGGSGMSQIRNTGYSGYNDQHVVSHQIMNAGYNCNQESYSGGRGGGIYGGSGMSQMGSSGPSPSRHYMNDRMSGRHMGHQQMQRKRLPQRSPGCGPGSKQANIESDRHLAKPHRNRGSRSGSKSHTAKIDELLSIRREKKKETREDEKDKKSPEQDKKKANRKQGNWCTACECAFTGNYLAHRRTKKHRQEKEKKYPKCHPCRMGFTSSQEYRDHCKSEEHKQRSAEFHYLKNLASGSDEDEAAIQPAKVEDEKEEPTEVKSETKEVEDNATMSEDKESEEGKGDETKEKGEEEEKKEVKKPTPKEPKYVGQSFVVSVQGYYCKLCHKFFKDVSVAKSKHCRSIMHTEAFKRAMVEAVEQEEERQKLAEEQDKQDKETAGIEHAAKEAAKKELAAKKAGVSKDDVEMKDISEETVKGDAVSKDTKDESANEDGMENGLKQELKEEMDDSDEAKDSAAEDKKDSEVIKEAVDEEQEETKEEITSQATR